LHYFPDGTIIPTRRRRIARQGIPVNRKTPSGILYLAEVSYPINEFVLIMFTDAFPDGKFRMSRNISIDMHDLRTKFQRRHFPSSHCCKQRNLPG
jgi:hypothetical protein